MKILLVDPGLLNRHGHHFHTDLAIYDECKARGIAVSVLGNRDVEPEIASQIPVRPVFEATAYPSRDGASDRDLRADFETFNRMMERDLRRAVDEPLCPDDLVLVPTARDIHLTGIYRWYAALAPPRPRVCLRLVFAPWFRARADERDLAIELSRNQMRAWASLPPEHLTLVSERREMAGLYEGLCGAAVTVLPMPIRYPDAAAHEPAASDGTTHFVFLGEARREKGFHMYPEAFAPIFRSHPELRLTLQTSCLFDVGEEVVEQVEALSPRVSAVRQILSVEDYERLLVSSDAVLVTYDPQTYALRTSQIFLEAVGLGKVAVATRGTWMHEYMSALGIDDVCMESFTTPALTHALEQILSRWSSVAAKARRAAPASRERHNPAAFVDALLRATGHECSSPSIRA